MERRRLASELCRTAGSTTSWTCLTRRRMPVTPGRPIARVQESGAPERERPLPLRGGQRRNHWPARGRGFSGFHVHSRSFGSLWLGQWHGDGQSLLDECDNPTATIATSDWHVAHLRRPGPASYVFTGWSGGSGSGLARVAESGRSGICHRAFYSAWRVIPVKTW